MMSLSAHAALIAAEERRVARRIRESQRRNLWSLSRQSILRGAAASVAARRLKKEMA